MRFDVESLLHAPDAETVVDFDERLDFPEELGAQTQPVRGRVTIARALDGSLFRVTGHLETEATLVCDRCLGPAPTRIAFDLDETLTVTEAPSQAQEVEETVNPHGELDLSDLLRQHMILNVPSRSLCGCEPEYLAKHRPVDPRWRQLEALRSRTTTEES